MNTSLLVEIGIQLGNMSIHFWELHTGVCVENHINRHPSLDHQQKHCGTVFPTGKTYGMKLFLITPTHVGSTLESSFRRVRVRRCTFRHPGRRWIECTPADHPHPCKPRYRATCRPYTLGTRRSTLHCRTRSSCRRLQQ